MWSTSSRGMTVQPWAWLRNSCLTALGPGAPLRFEAYTPDGRSLGFSPDGSHNSKTVRSPASCSEASERHRRFSALLDDLPYECAPTCVVLSPSWMTRQPTSSGRMSLRSSDQLKASYSSNAMCAHPPGLGISVHQYSLRGR